MAEVSWEFSPYGQMGHPMVLAMGMCHPRSSPCWTQMQAGDSKRPFFARYQKTTAEAKLKMAK